MRSVLPPWLQGVAWWASVQGAGTVQSSARQWGCCRARALRWAGVNSRAVRPRSRTSDSGAEDGGDEAGGAGEPAGFAGGDGLAGAELRGPEARLQGLQGHGDHHGGGQAAVVGQRSGVEAFEEGAERVAALPVGGQPDAGGRVDAVALPRGAGAVR